MITGMAGFIGFHTAIKFKKEGYEVCGFDNFNDYYDPELKYDRAMHLKNEYGITVHEGDLRDSASMSLLVGNLAPTLVLHLSLIHI